MAAKKFCDSQAVVWMGHLEKILLIPCGNTFLAVYGIIDYLQNGVKNMSELEVRNYHCVSKYLA